MRHSLTLVVLVLLLFGCSDTEFPQVVQVESPELNQVDDSVAILSSGICAPESACRSFVQLLFDGTLRVNRSGQYPEVVHKAKVTMGEMNAVILLASDRDLAAFLQAENPCPPGPTDGGTWIYVKSDAANGQQPPCIDAAVALFNALLDLRTKYFPEPLSVNGDS